MSDGGGPADGPGGPPGGGPVRAGERPARPRVIVTRAVDQAAELLAALDAEGCEALACPVIRTEPAATSALAPCLDGLDRYDWAVFTSENGVRHFLALLLAPRREQERQEVALLLATGRDARALGRARLAAVGPGTAAALAAAGLRADFVPAEHRGEGLLREMAAGGLVSGLRVLRVRGDKAGPEVEEGLRAGGATVDVVTAYRTLPAEPPAAALAAIRAGGVAAVTFYSPSAVAGFERCLPDHGLHASAPAVCVGPVTAAAAAAAGWARVLGAGESTTAAVVALLRAVLAGRPAG